VQESVIDRLREDENLFTIQGMEVPISTHWGPWAILEVGKTFTGTKLNMGKKILNCIAFHRSHHTNGIGMNAWAFVVNFVAIEGFLIGRFSYFRPIFHSFFQPLSKLHASKDCSDSCPNAIGSQFPTSNFFCPYQNSF